MANISKPKSDNLQGLSQVPVPVSYSTLTGLALLLSDIIVSGEKVVPYVRTMPTSAFISGSYSFPTPDGYVAAPYQLPMLEPQSWNVVADIISAYRPVALYQIGNKSYVNDQGITVPADLMQNTFPINIYPSTYPSDAGTIKPIELNQSVIVRIYKNAGVNINWQGSNVVNNGLTDAAIQGATELTFVVTNVLGMYQVTEWITPDFVLSNLNSLPTTAKTNLAAVISEIYNRGILAGSTAGGDLTGTYPNPMIGNGKVTASKMANGVIPTSLPPSGNAGGDLTGTYPSPTIGTGKVTNDKLAGGITASKLALGVIPTSLPPTGTAGGSLAGSYPNPLINHEAVGFNELTENARMTMVYVPRFLRLLASLTTPAEISSQSIYYPLITALNQVTFSGSSTTGGTWNITIPKSVIPNLAIASIQVTLESDEGQRGSSSIYVYSSGSNWVISVHFSPKDDSNLAIYGANILCYSYEGFV